MEHPNGIQLVPSGDDCEVEDPGDVKEVVQPGLWRDVLGLIAEIAPRDDDGIQTQSILDEVTSELLGAPRGGNLSEKLRTVATPIIQRWAKDTPPKSANTHGQQVTWMVGSIVLFCCFLLSITIIVFGLVWWNPRGQHQQPQTAPPGALAPPPALDQMIDCPMWSLGTQIPAAFHPYESNPSQGLKCHCCAVCTCFNGSCFLVTLGDNHSAT